MLFCVKLPFFFFFEPLPAVFFFPPPPFGMMGVEAGTDSDTDRDCLDEPSVPQCNPVELKN